MLGNVCQQGTNQISFSHSYVYKSNVGGNIQLVEFREIGFLNILTQFLLLLMRGQMLTNKRDNENLKIKIDIL